MLHSSLQDLTAEAPHAHNLAMLKGILVEAADLARNAVDHASDPLALSRWYATIVRGALASPAAQTHLAGYPLFPTGALGRGEALPSSPLRLVCVDPNVGALPPTALELLDAFAAAGAPLAVVNLMEPEYSLLPDNDLGYRPAVIDALDSGVPEVVVAFLSGQTARKAQEAMAEEFVNYTFSRKPPAVRAEGGLPVLEMDLDVDWDLIAPTVRLARWYATLGVLRAPSVEENANRLLAACGASTPERFELAAAWGVIEPGEVVELRRVHRASLGTQWQRWRDGVAPHDTSLLDLPQVQRSIFTAASRSIADALHATQQKDVLSQLSRDWVNEQLLTKLEQASQPLDGSSVAGQGAGLSTRQGVSHLGSHSVGHADGHSVDQIHKGEEE